MTNEELWRRIERGFRNLTPGRQIFFNAHIVEHCNLNCKSCNSFAPLAEKEYIDVNSYKNDCDRLSVLLDGEVSSILIMGGDPLLHPQIAEIIKITRTAFPIGTIGIATNGLLLPAMSEDFWEACKRYDIIIMPTCYPINVDYDSLEKLAKSKDVKYNPLNSAHTVQRKEYPICTKRLRNPSTGIVNYMNCASAGHCMSLKNGKLYPCAQAARVSLLKQYYNLDIHLSEKNGVDIYSVKSGDELLEKISRPIPLCEYCDVTDAFISSSWGTSRKDRYEWLAFEFTADDIEYLKLKTPAVYVFGAGVWGNRAVAILRNEGIAIKSVLVTRKKQGVDNIHGVPIISLDEVGEVESNSLCLVALDSPIHKAEVYPLLSKIGFGDIVPISL